MSDIQDPGLNESRAQLLAQLVESHGVDRSMRVLAHMSGYEDVPPTMKQFIDDPHFMGSVLSKTIYPIWRNALYEIFPNPFYSQYLEIIVTGAIGTGKSTVSIAGSLYDMCKISYLKSPQEHFNLVKSTKITLALINATMDLAGGVLYDQMTTWMQESPFFRGLLNQSSGATLLPKNMHIVMGSRFTHILGMAVVSAILSEINFQTKAAEQAYQNFTNAKRRIQSRFLTGGSYPGRLWLDSSKADNLSFLDTHIKDSVNDPLVKVYDNPIWVVKAHTGIYSGKKFKVFIGDDKRDPFILEHAHQIVGLDDAHVIDVPVEYQNDFKLDLNNSLKDLAGVGTYSNLRFISSAEVLDRSFTNENACMRDVLVLDFFDKSDRILDYIDWNKLEQHDKPKFMHIDLGLKHDLTGIGISHMEGLRTVSRDDPFTGKTNQIREPVFKTDLVIAIKAKNGQEVPIYKIKEFIIALVSRGYFIATVTMDGFQSSNLRQDLQIEGIETDYLSTDRSKDPYTTLRNAMFEGRYSGPSHPILIKEVRELVDTGPKLDHPPSGSKDLSDAVAGSIYASYKYMDKFSIATKAEQYLEAMTKISEGSGSVYHQILNSPNAFVIDKI